MFGKLKRLIIGNPRNPLQANAHQSVALIAFFAWVGLGADGLSSSSYGPEEAFIALGHHAHLALYLAPAMAITVFVISIAYNQVIELFPNGGGGYKVASQLLGKNIGVVAGSALLIDYILTIAISLASGVDAMFSLLPPHAQHYKVATDVLLLVILVILNLRGMKESIKVLLPIFLGFFITHVILITYGIFCHGSQLPSMISSTVAETRSTGHSLGWLFVIALFLKSYSVGGGTYTGLEAVSNNVNTLAEPRVRTGKWTMFYMALSLSFTAGGIILLYLLWHVTPVKGETLNAVTFGMILQNWPFHHVLLFIVLALEAGLLFVGANTGFLGGPAVLGNMAMDLWVPSRFRSLSSRLVTQNGIILFGLAALVILLWTHGRVSFLVVLYSINVFLTFSLAILGLCVYWWRHRKRSKIWRSRLALSVFSFIVCFSILIITLFEKFEAGGWVTVLLTTLVIFLCFRVKKYYKRVIKQIKDLDEVFINLKEDPTEKPQAEIDPSKPTAVFYINRSIGAGMHTLLWAHQMFPNHFKNFVFVRVGVVDAKSFGSEKTLKRLKNEMSHTINHFIRFCNKHGIAVKEYHDFATDPVECLTDLSTQISEEFPNCVFFATKYIFARDNWLTRFLHSDTAMLVQRRLHLKGIKMLIMPMQLGGGSDPKRNAKLKKAVSDPSI